MRFTKTILARFLLRRNAVALFSMFLLLLVTLALMFTVIGVFALDRFSRLNFVEGALFSGTALIALGGGVLIRQYWATRRATSSPKIVTATGEDTDAIARPSLAAMKVKASEPLILAIAFGPLLHEIYRAPAPKTNSITEVNHDDQDSTQLRLAA